MVDLDDGWVIGIIVEVYSVGVGRQRRNDEDGGVGWARDRGMGQPERLRRDNTFSGGGLRLGEHQYGEDGDWRRCAGLTSNPSSGSQPFGYDERSGVREESTCSGMGVPSLKGSCVESVYPRLPAGAGPTFRPRLAPPHGHSANAQCALALWD